MKFPFKSTLLLLALTSAASATPPRKVPLSSYSNLWNNSPFTSKPLQAEAGPEINPLDDYALIGVSPIATGYRVTLINTKKPEERITVDSGSDATSFKILGVTRKDGDPLGTTVRMAYNSMTGTVAFDSTLLTIAANANANAGQIPAPNGQIPGQIPPQQRQLINPAMQGIPNAQGNPNMQGNPNLPQNQGNPAMPQPGIQRQPRPRVIPPPVQSGISQPGVPVQRPTSPVNPRPSRRPQ